MSKQFTPITIIPVHDALAAHEESTAFREVIAYLNGVADTMAAQCDCGRPISLLPDANLASHSSRASVVPTRVTLRFGEIAFERASIWPQVAVGSTWEPTRGGARMVDLGVIDATRAGGPTLRRCTLPYDMPSVSLAPFQSAPPPWSDERQSEVRLRAAHLPIEWYELTGTEGEATEMIFEPYPVRALTR
jgi:hypothetical protein